ncbi:uncharacterized protein LOC124476665 [Hypomesus transpacificus]|uniref:uncharacterized protein LOC124476665 n=1 Tax=Hypomesus transpacificus TaxID=137520 RepID=UPI001F076501|nr:uncharacterized protein LOC124476665 [Hypomesus transpacificus]
MFVWVCFLLSVSFCSAGAFLDTARVCYGTEYVFPSKYKSYFTITKLFFKPSYPQGSPKTLVLDKLELKAPRYKSSFSTLRIPDVTEEDDGIFSIMYVNGVTFDILELEVTACSSKVELTYGSRFLQTVVNQASTLDFLPLDSSSEQMVLWNQTNTKARIEGMGVFIGYSWLVKFVTQKHQGHYTFRNSDGRILSRTKLEVKEHVEWHTVDSEENIFINFALDSNECDLNFFPEGETEAILLIKNGIEMYGKPINDKVRILGRRSHFAFKIADLENKDSGKFELRDQDNNLALVVWLKVKSGIYMSTHIFVGVFVIFLVGLYCCVRKCCPKRKASKQNASPSGSGQVVVHQDETCHMTSQPSGPSYPSPPYFQSYASEPVVTISPAEPSGPTYPYQSTAPPPNPSSNDTTTLKDDPHTQVSTSTGLDPPSFSLGFGFLSSDSETQFKLPQRLNHRTDFFPSSDPSSSADVYISDKLNFR